MYIEQATDADGDRLVVLCEQLPGGPAPRRIVRERDLALIVSSYPDRNVTLAIYPLGALGVEVPTGADGISEGTAQAIQCTVADRVPAGE
jgi:hypothetical protein